MRLASLAIGMWSVTAPGLAQGTFHFVEPASTTHLQATPQIVAQRIAAAARGYEAYAPIPRGGFYEIAFPADAREYQAMAGHGLLLVTTFSQLQNELPATPYLVTRQGSVKLRLLSSVVGGTTLDDERVRRVFGKFRIDALFLLPLHSGARGADLLVDFARTRSGFKLGVINPSLPEELRDIPNAPTGGEPAPEAILLMARREYPAFVASK